jgi:hypothetical protein
MNQALINQARSANLIDYFQSKGYELEQQDKEYYVKAFPGLCITPSECKWFSHYKAIGGTNAINCLTKILDYDFRTAVSELTGADITTTTLPPMNEQGKTVEGVVMPPRANNERRVIAYLCQKRLIPYEIVADFITKGKLYQADERGNAVFPHIKHGKVVGAEIHGVTDERFKGTAKGTRNSVFSWRCSAVLKRAYVFESAIDLMSFIALHKQSQLDGCVLLSVGGTKEGVFEGIAHEIRAKGIEVLSCADNDQRGREFEHSANLTRVCNTLECENVKDWNDLLRKSPTILINIEK